MANSIENCVIFTEPYSFLENSSDTFNVCLSILLIKSILANVSRTA